MSVVPGTVNLDPDGVNAYGSLAAPQADAEGAQGAAASPSRADKAYDDWNAGWNAAIAALAQQRDAEVEALVEAGIALIDRYQRDGEHVISRFERIAAMFKRDTGFTAPGKDVSPAAYEGAERGRERDERWNAWCKQPIDRFRAALRPFHPISVQTEQEGF